MEVLLPYWDISFVRLNMHGKHARSFGLPLLRIHTQPAAHYLSEASPTASTTARYPLIYGCSIPSFCTVNTLFSLQYIRSYVLVVWPLVLCLSVCTQLRLVLLLPGRIPLPDSTHIYSHSFLYAVLRGFLSSLPRWLRIRFFSKALVGEHRALSFLYVMVMIMTLPCSPGILFARHLLHLHPCRLKSISSYK